jgi:hypothetical protein
MTILNRLFASCAVLAALLVPLAPASFAQSNPIALQNPLAGDEKWGGLALQDLDFLRKQILSLHPLASDPADAAFKQRVEAAYTKALEQARFAKNYTAYIYSLNSFLYTLDDETIQLLPKNPPEFLDWVGFLLDYQNGKPVVRSVDADIPGVETRVVNGWPLLNCETIAYEDYVKQRLEGLETGSLGDQAKLIRNNAKIFIDYRNPQNNRPSVCEFATSDGKRRVRLTWRPMSEAIKNRLKDDLAAIARVPQKPDVRVRYLANGAVWIHLSSLDGFVAKEALNSVVEELRKENRSIRRAPFVVIDVRGNQGGQTFWAQAIAQQLCSKDQVAAQAPQALRYRATREVQNTLEQAATKIGGAFGMHYTKIAQNIAQAIEKGDAFASITVQKSVPPSAAKARSDRAGLVFMLTDAGCINACLEARDLFLNLGALQIGEITSPSPTLTETLFEAQLPSGNGLVRLPLAAKQVPPAPQAPLNATWTGRMDDDAAIVPWISDLALTRRRLVK